MPPMQKIPQPTMMVIRRPMKSARSPAMIAPKKVPEGISDCYQDVTPEHLPADRMEVVRDCCHDGTLKNSLR
jgi:hypothetical protein